MFAKLMRHSNGKPQCEGNGKRAHTCIHRNWFTDLAGFAHAREYNFLSVSQRSGLGLTVFHACEPVNNYYPGNPNEDHDCGTRAPEMLRIGCSLFANQQRRMMSKEQNVEITETPQLSEYLYCKKNQSNQNGESQSRCYRHVFPETVDSTEQCRCERAVRIRSGPGTLCLQRAMGPQSASVPWT